MKHQINVELNQQTVIEIIDEVLQTEEGKKLILNRYLESFEELGEDFTFIKKVLKFYLKNSEILKELPAKKIQKLISLMDDLAEKLWKT